MRRSAAVVIGIVLAFGSASAVGAQESSSAHEPSAAASTDGLSLVGIGDSLPGALGCFGSCRSYVAVLGDLASAALGVPVVATNLATNDGLESPVLLQRVTTDETHREALAGADIITVQIGLNDWQGMCTWDGLAACLAVGAAAAEANLDAILAEIGNLRAGEPTAVRVVTYFDPYVGTAQAPEWWAFDPAERDAFEEAFAAELTDFNARLCAVAEAHDAVCVDTRTPINGPGWDIEAVPEPADGAIVLGGDDHLHLTALGHEIVAQAIAAAGYAPISASG